MQSVILGTAQWGLDYGITNRHGRMTLEVVDGVFGHARQLGITRLDTAPAYGDAEERIGRLNTDIAVQTKVSARGLGESDVRASIDRSLARLGVPVLAAVLVHDWAELSASERANVAMWLEAVRSGGTVERVGVSAYDAEELEAAASCFSQLDVVQVPVNVLDQRLDSSSVVNALRGRGTRVQARSALLQGVALAPERDAPFGSHPDVMHLVEARDLWGVGPADLCLGYVRSRTWVDDVVLAPTSVPELDTLWSAWTSDLPNVPWSTLASEDVTLIDPRRWPPARREG